MNRARNHAVVLAGGLGVRLWPRSRAVRPKQFLPVDNGVTLLQQTVNRILPLFAWERIWVVTKPEHQEETLAQVPGLRRANVLVEPMPRGTAAAIAWATVQIERRHPGSVVGVFPTDHLVRSGERFRDVVSGGLAWAAEHEDLVTFGVTPMRPETAYGYIEAGSRKGGASDVECFEVLGFHEKPERRAALEYIASGRALWNTGIFAFSAKTLMNALMQWAPVIPEILERIPAPGRSGPKDTTAQEMYGEMPEESLDRMLLERAANVVVFRADFDWHDMGVWETAYALSRKDADGNALDGTVVVIGCRDSLVISGEGTLVAAVGLEEVVIVAENGAVLVCPRCRLDEVRKVVGEIRQRGLTRYL